MPSRQKQRTAEEWHAYAKFLMGWQYGHNCRLLGIIDAVEYNGAEWALAEIERILREVDDDLKARFENEAGVPDIQGTYDRD